MGVSDISHIEVTMEAIDLYLWREARKDPGDTAFRRMDDNKRLGSLRKSSIRSDFCPRSPWFSWSRRLMREQMEGLLPECGSVQESHPTTYFRSAARKAKKASEGLSDVICEDFSRMRRSSFQNNREPTNAAQKYWCLVPVGLKFPNASLS